MDEGLGVVIEEVRCGIDDLEPEVDIGPCLVDGERLEVGSDTDPLSEVDEVRRSEVLMEGVLACEEDFDFGSFIESRRDKES